MHYELERDIVKREFTTVATYFLSSTQKRTYVGKGYFYTPEFEIGLTEPLSPTAIELVATQCLAMLKGNDTIGSTLAELPADNKHDLARRVKASTCPHINVQWTVN